MKILLGIIVSYLIGAIPTAYIFGKSLKGIDIRQHGSGNMGATNVFRVLGKGPGFAVLFLDILKGFLAVVVVTRVLQLEGIAPLLIMAVSAVCGHNWTIFLGFKGGKGIATSLGALIGITVIVASMRIVVLGVVLVWIVTFLIYRYVSLSSIIAAIFLPVLMVLTNQPLGLVTLGVVLGVFVVLRHRPNIRRLLSGQESRVPLNFGKK